LCLHEPNDEDDFIWSFGGDSDADQAIAEWKQDDKYLRALDRVLRNGCKPAQDNRQVECPGKGGTSFRAGFEKTPSGWRMSSFVEGD
jgi:hypothetical protein